MTPQEKAKELVKKMYGNIFDGGRFEDAEESLYKAKQCALIAVDEMINMCKLYHNHNAVIVTKIYTELTIDYFKQVKHEIEKL